MTDTLRIDRLRARYRLAPSQRSARERLDRLLAEVLEGGLDAALERSGPAVTGEVCVRDVHAPIRLRLGSADSALASAWSDALAAAIRAAIARGAPDVVRYASRRHALADLAACVAEGRLERAWAWRSMGLWRAADGASVAQAAAELLAALLAEPEAIVAVVAAVAEQTLLGRLASKLAPAALAELARAGLAVAHAPAELADPMPAARAPGPPQAAGAAPAAAAPVHSIPTPARLAAVSAIARSLREEPDVLAAGPAARRALAVLAALEAEPAALGADPARARALVDALAAAPAAPVAPAPEVEAEAGAADRAGAEAAVRSETALGEPDDLTLDPELDRPALTEHGGLLFLLHVVDELGLHERLVEPPLAERTLRWSLHRLAAALTSLHEDDPAALAFAGLPPDAPPPSLDDDPPSEAEDAALDAATAAIGDRLRELFECPDEPVEQLLERVCRRDAEIVGDPGWIELRLSLDDVSVDVRRAGLDLDPGYVAWLGCVVRFVYG